MNSDTILLYLVIILLGALGATMVIFLLFGGLLRSLRGTAIGGGYYGGYPPSLPPGRPVQRRLEPDTGGNQVVTKLFLALFVLGVMMASYLHFGPGLSDPGEMVEETQPPHQTPHTLRGEYYEPLEEAKPTPVPTPPVEPRVSPERPSKVVATPRVRDYDYILGTHGLQFAAYTKLETAMDRAEELTHHGHAAHVYRFGNFYTVVIIGMSSLREAAAYRRLYGLERGTPYELARYSEVNH